ncbi:hypothetical protein HJ590_13060 [Naumannella sp. ID2617S]|nr:hypothetical protein [Naumannella sp. ID2617S]
MTGQQLSGLVLLTGMLAGAGLVAMAYGLRRTAPRLADALAELDGRPATATPVMTGTAAGSDRIGLWFYRHTPIPLLDSQLRLLELRNRSVAEFFTEKLVMALLGACVPTVLGVAFTFALGIPLAIPAIAALAGLVLGYFVPDLLLHRSAEQSRGDAMEALFCFFDLVTLERLANRSATQSLQEAAQASDHPLFLAIRGALLRARLEQQAPYAELRRLADRLRLPQLADVGDVMQLDEQGAAVADTLRARVRELRDAHLTEARVAAHEVSERMTVFMAVPALVFGLIFLIPPLIRLVG